MSEKQFQSEVDRLIEKYNPTYAANWSEAAEPAALSPAQEVAMENLATGVSISKAAQAAGVDPRTVRRWFASDPNFAAAYNAWRQELVASSRARVLAMTDLALDAVHSAIQKGDARVALQIARAGGAMDAPPPGTTDPDELRRRRKIVAGRRELRLIKAERDFRKDTGQEDKSCFRDVAWLEEQIRSFLQLRGYALQDESPEARAARLSPENAPGPYSREAESKHLMELYDATVEARKEFWRTGKRDRLLFSVPGAPAPLAPPPADAEPAPAPVAPVPPAPPAAAEPGPPLSTSSGLVAYDGSDESDNDPLWIKLT